MPAIPTGERTGNPKRFLEVKAGLLEISGGRGISLTNACLGHDESRIERQGLFKQGDGLGSLRCFGLLEPKE